MKTKMTLTLVLLFVGVCLGCSGCLAGLPQHTESQTESSQTEKEEMDVPDTEKFQSMMSRETEAETEPETEPLSGEEKIDMKVQMFLDTMTLEEKVAQLFIVLPDTFLGVDGVTAAGEVTREAIRQIPVGGFIYMSQNLQSSEQVREMTAAVQSYSMERTGLPMFLCVDEEGGTVSRISGRGLFDVPDIGNMCDVGARGNVEEARRIGETIGAYLSELGFNIDFAPDADVLSNPDNSVVRYRSFGSDPELVSEMSAAVLNGLQTKGVNGVLKHFPGHGATEGDTHEGYAYTSKTLEELKECELVPFQEGILTGVHFIMAGHISTPNVTGNETPASLSYTMITEILREQMGYEGIVVTDAMNMGAVAGSFTSADAAVMAVNAGVDLILMPADFQSAYSGVLEAVKSGTVSEERIDESLRRILRIKLTL
ncbi:MAG: glycoside hydrolase family 3 protein [Candidatus Choladocola sp.]|nr:glycoside hydrolase family 3 protein [Candidatus Choladocola sp.]